MDTSPQMPDRPLELWGGVECSVVRLRDRLENQLARTGHDTRLSDLDRFAELGLRALRYPILWDLHGTGAVDWRWADERLHRLRELGVRPIVGLVHHGCGPLRDGMIDPGFAPGVAQFARQVAERYPWIDAYTPINEPLTTARFSGMYDLWHPHGRSVESFVRVFMQECRAVRAAMRAIRAINPAAQLVQTEDLGKSHSTPRLAYQADFENERRWATFDLLCGQLTPDRPMWGYLRAGGIAEAELYSFLEDSCPPDVLGMNHYVTSERFLDERIARYPGELQGGNGRDRYADVPAVRVRAEGVLGPAELLRELWARYHRPIAVTEIQLACTREEQVRWLLEFWHAAQEVRADGVDVRALTAWALLGARDWDSLLVRRNGSYECGAFDVRGPAPRLTAVGGALRALAREGRYQHPILANAGWWRRPVRFEFAPLSAPRTGFQPPRAGADGEPGGPPLLVLGAGGRLSRMLSDLCRLRGLALRSVEPTELAGGPDGDELLARGEPWAVIDASAEAVIDRAELEPGSAPRAEHAASAHLAQWCAARGLPLLAFSSARVFGAERTEPWLEHDRAAPREAAGECLLAREEEILAAHRGTLLVRSGPWFSAADDGDFLSRTLRALEERQTIVAPDDLVLCPAHLPDVIHAALDLLIDGERGVWHIASAGRVSWHEWTRAIAGAVGYRSAQIRAEPAARIPWAAAEPRWTVLGTTRGELLAPWERALERCLRQIEQARARLAQVA